MNNKDMVELRECPFCGSGDVALVGHDYVHCDNCEADGPYNYDFDPEAAATKWNTRTGVERLTGEVARLREALAIARNILSANGLPTAPKIDGALQEGVEK